MISAGQGKLNSFNLRHSYNSIPRVSSNFSIPRDNSNFNIHNISHGRISEEESEEAHETKEESSYCNNLLTALKKSLYQNNLITGTFNALTDSVLLDLIEDSDLGSNFILKNELTHQMNMLRIEEESEKVPANFSLVEHMRGEKSSEQLEDYIEIGMMRIKKLSKHEKQSSISKYLSKKQRRKSKGYIRYQVRKDLAVKRKRHKGKFIKNNKIDLKRAAEMYLQKELNQNLQDLKIQSN